LEPVCPRRGPANSQRNLSDGASANASGPANAFVGEPEVVVMKAGCKLNVGARIPKPRTAVCLTCCLMTVPLVVAEQGLLIAHQNAAASLQNPAVDSSITTKSLPAHAPADLLAAHVPRSVLHERAPASNSSATDADFGDELAESDLNLLKPGRTEPTSAQRWEKFETEFAVGERSPSPVLSLLQTAKYNLDKFVFTVMEMENAVEEALEFDHEFGAPAQSARTKTTQRRKDRVRLATDVDIDTVRAEVYVALRLVVPLD
jgi:hypothetical protein